MKSLLLSDFSHPGSPAWPFSTATLISNSWENEEQAQGVLGLSFYLLSNPGQAESQTSLRFSQREGVHAAPSNAHRSLCLAHPADHTVLHCELCSVMSSSHPRQSLGARFRSHASTPDCSLEETELNVSIGKWLMIDRPWRHKDPCAQLCKSRAAQHQGA